MKNKENIWTAIPLFMMVALLVHILSALIFNLTLLSFRMVFFVAGGMLLGTAVAVLLGEKFKSE